MELHAPAHMLMAQRKRLLFVCSNRRPDGTPKGSCAARGSVEIHEKLKAALKRGKLAESGGSRLHLELPGCLLGGPLHRGRARPLLLRASAARGRRRDCRRSVTRERVERLVLAERDFLEPKELRRRGVARSALRRGALRR